MSSSLEGTYTCMLNNQVPEPWARVAYPSLKPLAAWLKDLQARLLFFSSWLRRGAPPCFWLAAFFFPQVRANTGNAAANSWLATSNMDLLL